MKALIFSLFCFCVLGRYETDEEFELYDSLTLKQRWKEFKKIQRLAKIQSGLYVDAPLHVHYRTHHHHCGVCGCSYLFRNIDRSIDEIEAIDHEVHRMIEEEETPRGCPYCIPRLIPSKRKCKISPSVIPRKRCKTARHIMRTISPSNNFSSRRSLKSLDHEIDAAMDPRNYH
ncbi:Uncharacterized protein QTN25_008566 [Entamoeba marina]